jgi:hypothetical protein
MEVSLATVALGKVKLVRVKFVRSILDGAGVDEGDVVGLDGVVSTAGFSVASVGVDEGVMDEERPEVGSVVEVAATDGSLDEDSKSGVEDEVGREVPVGAGDVGSGETVAVEAGASVVVAGEKDTGVFRGESVLLRDGALELKEAVGASLGAGLVETTCPPTFPAPASAPAP